MNQITRIVMKNLLIFILFCLSLYSYSQVTIGSDQKPIRGALLDLKSLPVNNPTSPTSDGNITSKTGGLIFSRVKLVDEKSLEPIISNPSNHDKIIHTGLTVYNLNETSPFKSGLYCWDGNKWGTLTPSGSDTLRTSYRLRYFYDETQIDHVVLNSSNTTTYYDLTTPLTFKTTRPSNLLALSLYCDLSLSNTNLKGSGWFLYELAYVLDGNTFQYATRNSGDFIKYNTYQTNSYFISASLNDIPVGTHTITFKIRLKNNSPGATSPYYIGVRNSGDNYNASISYYE